MTGSTQDRRLHAVTRLPVSNIQRAMLLDEALWPGSSAGGFFAALITGDLSKVEIERACLAAIGAVPPLNATLANAIDDPEWVQDPAPPSVGTPTYAVPLVAGVQDWKQRVRDWCLRHWSTPVPSQERPIRFAVFEVAQRHHVAVFAVSHLSFDGTSKFLFAELLERVISGRPIRPQATPFPEPEKRPFATRGYWTRERLARLIAAAEPLPKLRSTGRNSTTKTVHFDQSVSHELEAACRSSRVTLFEGLLGLLHFACRRHYDRRPVVLVPVDLRARKTRKAIGLLAHNVPILFDEAGGDDFESLAREARQHKRHLMRAAPNDFSNILKLVEPRHRRLLLTGAAFRQLTFAFMAKRKRASISDREPRLQWDMFIANAGQSTMTAVHARKLSERLLLRIDFNPDFVKASWAEALFQTLQEAIHSVAAAPERPLTTRLTG